MSAFPEEVRQCPSCEHPAVLLVMDWKHSMNGMQTHESTKEYRCQDCGAWQVRQARSRVIAMWILGVIFSIPCFFGLPFLFLAWRQSNFDKRVPIVPGAMVPRLRFPGGPPLRTCGKCSGRAKAMKITRHSHNGMPTGTDYEYVCAGCGLQFTTENFLGHAFSFFGGVVLAGVALGFAFGAKDLLWRLGGTIVVGALATFVLGQSVTRIMNRFKHKELVETVL